MSINFVVLNMTLTKIKFKFLSEKEMDHLSCYQKKEMDHFFIKTKKKVRINQISPGRIESTIKQLIIDHSTIKLLRNNRRFNLIEFNSRSQPMTNKNLLSS